MQFKYQRKIHDVRFQVFNIEYKQLFFTENTRKNNIENLVERNTSKGQLSFALNHCFQVRRRRKQHSKEMNASI